MQKGQPGSLHKSKRIVVISEGQRKPTESQKIQIRVVDTYSCT